MKNSWMIMGFVLLLIAGIGLLTYLFASGAVTGTPMLLLVWLLIFGILALAGGIAWMAGLLSRKKTTTLVTPEPKPLSAVFEAPRVESSPLVDETKAEPSRLAEEVKEETSRLTEDVKAEPSRLIEEIKEETSRVTDEVKVAPSSLTEEVKGEASSLTEEVKTKPRRLTEEVKAKPSQRSIKEKVGRGSRIIDIEGIGTVFARKLNSIDIHTSSDLLEAGGTPLGRKELAERTGISHEHILEWVNIADLLRIKGVGEEYSDLLEEAGVDTVVELSKRIPEHLHDKMVQVNEKKKLVRRTPTLSEVKQWVEEAKGLPRKIEY